MLTESAAATSFLKNSNEKCAATLWVWIICIKVESGDLGKNTDARMHCMHDNFQFSLTKNLLSLIFFLWNIVLEKLMTTPILNNDIATNWRPAII